MAHGVHRAHVVQPVCHLNQHYPHVVANTDKKLSKILALHGGIHVKNSLNFGQAFDDIGHIGPKQMI